MNYRAFNNYINEVMNAIDSQHNRLDGKAGTNFFNNGKWALRSLERIFKDKEKNIRRWLNGKPCVFTSDRTGQRIEIIIGPDREALYYFLIFCKKIAEKEVISEDLRNYVTLLITRSTVRDEDWEEC